MSSRSGNARCEVVADLLWAPILPQTPLDGRGQCRVLELARLGSSGPQVAPFLGGMRTVGAGAVLAVTTQLPRDRARCPPKLPGDLPHAGPGQAEVSYDQAVVLAEVSA